MKQRYFWTPVLLAGILLLCCGCGSRLFTLEGELTGAAVTENGTVLTLKAEKEKERTVLVDQSTQVFGNGLMNPEQLRSGAIQNGFRLMVELTAAPGSPRQAKFLSASAVKEEYALPDGTALAAWRSDSALPTTYSLEEDPGTVLVYENTFPGPESVYVVGLESYDDLTKTAQAQVTAYFQQLGLLYDLNDVLQDALTDYRQKSADGKLTEFSSWNVGQETSPYGASSTVMYFLTSTTLPLNGQSCDEILRCDAFDRTTGEHLNNEDLFTCPKEELLSALLSSQDWTLEGDTQPSLTEMQAAFRPEWLLISPHGVEINFPSGTLPSQEYSYMLGLDYTQQLQVLLRPGTQPLPQE